MKREFRFVRGQVRAEKKGDKQYITGYASVFNSPSQDLGGFREVVKPGAFKASIKSGDVRALMNHDPNLVLGRSTAGTLELEEDGKGLRFRCEMPNTSAARDLMESIKRGDIDGCSFGFVAKQVRWTNTTESPEYKAMVKDDDADEDAEDDADEDDRQVMIRELHSVDLFDVSAVTYPAYPATSVSMRSKLWPEGVPEELGENVPELREAKTKKVDGKDLHASDFAHVGDPEDPSTWKLPIHDAGHVRNALARFNQVKGLSEDEKNAAYKKIVAAAKKFGIKVSEEDSIRVKDPNSDPTEAQDVACECDCPECMNGDCMNCSDPECDDPNCEMNERQLKRAHVRSILAQL